MQRRQRGANIGLMLLLVQMYQFGFDNIAPVTLALLGLNIFLFLSPIKPLLYTCISVYSGYYQRDWQRFLLSPFHHVDDWHLYFNMVSLLWKGTKLERRLGSIPFAVIIIVFSQLIGVVYIGLQLMLAEWTDDSSYEMQCAVGFSGVLFALKVLNNHYHPGGSSNLFGIQVPNKYACWVELVAIHILSPGTSFVGHLSGILVGLLYTHGPLKWIMAGAGSLFTNCHPQRNREFHYSAVTQSWNGPIALDWESSGILELRVFRKYNQTAQMKPICPHVMKYRIKNCTLLQENDFTQRFARQPAYENQDHRAARHYTGGLNEEEQLQKAIRESLNERGFARQPAYENQDHHAARHYTGGLNEEEQLQQAIRESLNERGYQRTSRYDPQQPSLEEIRRRRLNRLNRLS
ncbi:rhomboid-related protein 4 [Gastrophryne carolinensis]